MSAIVFVELENVLATHDDIELSPINRNVQREIMYYASLGETIVILTTHEKSVVEKWLDQFSVNYDIVMERPANIAVDTTTIWKQSTILSGSLNKNTVRVFSADPEMLYMLRKYDSLWVLKLVSNELITSY